MRVLMVVLAVCVSLTIAPVAIAQEASAPDASAIQNSLLDQMGVPEEERPEPQGETPVAPSAEEKAAAERAEEKAAKKEASVKPDRQRDKKQAKPRFRFPFRPGKGFLRVKSYEQTQLPWGPLPFGNKPGARPMQSTACGATALAMAGSTLTGKFRYTPWYIAQRYQVVYQGSVSWYTRGTDYIVRAARHMGLSAWSIGLNLEAAREAIKNGGVVVVVFGPGRFTKGGHYLLAYRVSKGRLFLKDPYNQGQFGNNNESRPFSGKFLLNQGLYRMWVIKKPTRRR